jgi:hypothetical protein
MNQKPNESTMDEACRPAVGAPSDMPSSTFGDDERILLDGMGNGLRARYLSLKAPTLIALVNPMAGVARFAHPEYADAQGRPTECVGGYGCPLCLMKSGRVMRVGVPFIDLETRIPGYLRLEFPLVMRDGRQAQGYRQGSIEEAVYLTSSGGPEAVKFEWGGSSGVIGRKVVLPPELAYDSELSRLFFDWFSSSYAEIGLLLVAPVERAAILNDPRFRRRIAAAQL